MNNQEFETKLFEDIMQVLARDNVIVVDAREGYNILSGGQKAFGITVIGLYATVSVNGNTHNLSYDYASIIYNRCRELHDSNKDSQLIKTQKEILRVREQHNTLRYL